MIYDMRMSSFNLNKYENVYSQKYKRQHANNNGRVVILLPLKNFVQWQHKLTVAFKVFLQLIQLLTSQE